MSSKCSVCNTAVYANDKQLVLDGVKYHKACAKCADCSTQITLSNFTKAPDNTLLCKTHYFKRFHEEGQYAGGDQFQRKAASELRKEGRTASTVSDVSTATSTSTMTTDSIATSAAVAPSTASTSGLSEKFSSFCSVSSVTDDSTVEQQSARPVSERVVLDKPALTRDELKARRATFGGTKASAIAVKPTASSSAVASKCTVCNASIYANDPQIVLDGAKFHKGCAKCADCSTQITLSNFTKTPDNTLLCKTHYFKRFREEGQYAGGEQFKQKGTAEVRADMRKVGSTASGLIADGAGDVPTPAEGGAVKAAAPTVTAPSPLIAWSAPRQPERKPSSGNIITTTNTSV